MIARFLSDILGVSAGHISSALLVLGIIVVFCPIAVAARKTLANEETGQEQNDDVVAALELQLSRKTFRAPWIIILGILITAAATL
jgi:hypothetical protein